MPDELPFEPIKLKSPPGASPPFPSEIRSIQAGTAWREQIMERVEAGKPADVRAREQQSGPREVLGGYIRWCPKAGHRPVCCFFGIAIKSRAAATSRRGVISLLFRGPHSHTCDLVDFAGLRGKRCLIVGGRQSAFEWAALIHEAGAAAVHVCYRHDTPAFKTADWSWANRLVDLITKDPAWFRRLSVAQREEVNYSLWAEGRLKIEPWRIRDETIKLWLRSQVAGCIEQPDGALTVKLESGETIVVDQVIAATGYEVDIARVPFLAAGNLLSLDWILLLLLRQASALR